MPHHLTLRNQTSYLFDFTTEMLHGKFGRSRDNRRVVLVWRIGGRNDEIKATSTDLCNHWSRSWAVLQLKYLGPPLLGVTWKQWGLPRRLGCNGVTAARSIEVTACPHSRDSCERQPRRPAPRCFCRSSFVTLFVLFRGFDRNDRFEKKFCKWQKVISN